VKLLVLDSFDLAFRIIQEYRLPTVDVFQGAMRTLGRAKQITRIGELLRNIKVHDGAESVAGVARLADASSLALVASWSLTQGILPPDDCDSVVEAVVQVFARDLNDVKVRGAVRGGSAGPATLASTGC